MFKVTIHERYYQDLQRSFFWRTIGEDSPCDGPLGKVMLLGRGPVWKANGQYEGQIGEGNNAVPLKCSLHGTASFEVEWRGRSRRQFHTKCAPKILNWFHLSIYQRQRTSNNRQSVIPPKADQLEHKKCEKKNALRTPVRLHVRNYSIIFFIYLHLLCMLRFLTWSLSSW